MYRRIDDFTRAWQMESEATLKVLRALTEPALAQKMGPEGRTLGFLAWHLVLTLPEMMQHAGVPVTGPAHDAPPPPLAEIVRQYEESARAIGEGLPKAWNDAMLDDSGDGDPNRHILRQIVGELVGDLVDDGRDGGGSRLRWGGDLQTGLQKFAGYQVDRCALDAVAADVDSEADPSVDPPWDAGARRRHRCLLVSVPRARSPYW